MKKTFFLFVVLMLSILAQGQLPGEISYDFRDGTIIANGQSDDGLLTLSGNYSHHGTQYGMNMKVDGEINITVDGSCSFKFLGSQYSSLNMVGTAATEGDLGTQNTKVTNDLSDTYDFVYDGDAATLNFKTTAGTGNDLYLPLITVIPQQIGADAATAEQDVIYLFDLRDGSIIPNETSLNGNYTIEQGLFKIECGPSNAYGYNGDTHGSILKTGNKITLQVAGNSYIKLGGCIYSNGNVTLSSETGSFEVNSMATQAASEYHQEGTTLDFLYVGDAGTVTLEFTSGTTYIPVIKVVPVPYEVTLGTYAQKTGTVTLNGVEISLSTGATAADDATISLSSGIVLSSGNEEGSVAIDLGGADLSTLTPTVGGDIASATITDGKLELTFADESTSPNAYSIDLFDNSVFHNTTSYDFRDGTIISNGQSDDGSLTLSGNYSYHSANYGLNMKVDGEIKIAVDGSSSFSFLGSKYSSLNMIGSAAAEGDLGTQNTKVENDLSDTFAFAYGGSGDTVTFKTIAGTGNDLYLPLIDVVPAQKGIAYAAAENNIVYYFDFRDGSVVPTTTDGKSDFSKGLIEVKVGDKNAYGYNGSQHGAYFKEGNQILLQVAGNAKIRVGGCVYSNGTATASSATGSFDVSSQSTLTAGNYGQTGDTFDFLYVGDAGTVTLDFTGTTYIPYLEIVPVTYEVSLVQWVKKAGTITVNGTVISLEAGDDASSNATVTVSEGLVNSATAELATVRIDLGGKALSEYTPEVSGDIESVTVSGDTLNVTYADASTNPSGYQIIVVDNSQEVHAEAGKTYTYNFADGSVLPQTGYKTLRYTTFVTQDGILTLNSNTEDESLQYGYHDSSHGAVFFPGNSMDFIVAGDATITFTTCQYGSASDAVFEFTDAEGTVLGSVDATNIGVNAAGTSSFSYSGSAGTITATLKSAEHATAEIYIHAVTIENAATINESNGLTDVWDFGAEQLDTTLYNNQLTVELINSWYDPSIEAGSEGNVLPSFSAGVLSWIGGGNDRLRTTNTALTRYDANISSVEGYTGRVYVNSGANAGRYMSLALSEDDEVTIMALSQNGGGLFNFQYVGDPEAQTDQLAVGPEITEVKFVAKASGTYHIFDTQDKPSYYRIYRKDAEYATVSGAIDLTNAANIPEDYTIVFTNEAGKTWTVAPSDDTYSVQLPSGYNYELSLANANGFIISSGKEAAISEIETTHDLTLVEVQLFEVSGSLVGLDDKVANLSLSFEADPSLNKIYIPEPVVNAEEGTYSVLLEPDCEYTIVPAGVNDYLIPNNTLTISAANTSADITFEMKPVYAVTINAEGLNEEQKAKLGLTFTNLYEDGYTYNFSSIADIALRDGTYTLAYSGLNEYPLELGPTSNLTVEGAAATKTLSFQAVHNWSFDDQVIADGDQYYKGLVFSGSVKNEIAKGHIGAKPEATIQVPVNPGDKVVVTYYYSADFSIEGDAYSTSSGSTSTLEYASYVYPGAEAGTVTITIGDGAGTSYITNIMVDQVVDYAAVITVGADKDYQTINEALTAVSKMDRPNNERVTVMIDPGNYEEMLNVNTPNVTLKNAASMPSIDLANDGVDIAEGAVRITSYYGHGYNYYSMGNDQKWSADALRINKENGYLSYENAGAGTTNGSFWNATVVISAEGFVADHIIFENSFNQYISKKESEDVVTEWESGGKGTRPSDMGNTAVQEKSYVERAAALAITNNTDKVILNRCRVVGHQDSFFGGYNVRAVMYKGVMMGGTDYLFGGMTAVFYQSDLAMTTSDDGNDVSYITAAQQGGGRGYLMYECKVTSAEPGKDIASSTNSKPGYFGRPWQATTSEVVFYNTAIGTSDYPGSEGQSLINPVGWLSTLGGESAGMYEYGTAELSGENNQASRASWSTVLTEPKLNDDTEITTFNFTKGDDDWDPLPALIAGDTIDPDFVVENLIVGTIDSPEDYTCLANLDWDMDNVYLTLNITDDSIVNAGTSYQVDNIEVYFDMDNSKNIKWPRNGGWMSNDPTYDSNDYQLRLVPGIDFSVNNSFTGATQEYSETANGYRFKLTIPWDSLMEGFTPAIGTQIGFDLLASDNDAVASDANRNQVTLVSPTPNPYNDPSLFGTFQFMNGGKFIIIPDTEAPGLVSNFTATPDGSSVTLAWDNATDNIAILYYNLYQNYELIQSNIYPKETGNTYVVSNLEDGKYRFTMETVDNFGNVSSGEVFADATVTTVSVNDINASISVYPNPATRMLKITGMNDILGIDVVGLSGQVVKTYSGANTIDVSDLTKGVYVLKVRNGNQVLTTRFIKE